MFVLCLSRMGLVTLVQCLCISVGSVDPMGRWFQTLNLHSNYLCLLSCWYLEMQTREVAALLLLACTDCLPPLCVPAC